MLSHREKKQCPPKALFYRACSGNRAYLFLFSHIRFVFLWKALNSSDDLFHITETSYVFVWEPVSKQKRLLVLSQKQCFKFRNQFFFFKYTFIYRKNLEELKKQNVVAFFVCILKIWLCKEAKISWKFVLNCYTSKLTILLGGVKYFF